MDPQHPEKKIWSREKIVASKATGLWADFKKFALKGNVIDLAIAVVVGNAFSRIVNSLVSDIIQPLLGLWSGVTSLENAELVLRATSTPAVGDVAHPSVVLRYGDFLSSIESFVIIAGSIFLILKLISVARNRLFRKEQSGEAPAPTPSEEVKLLEEIRDLLKDRRYAGSRR
jgi:large conductance mechanosensitive channel